MPGSRKTSSAKRPASKTKRRSSRRHEYSDNDSSAFSLSPPMKNSARKKPATRKMSTMRTSDFNRSSNDEDVDDFDSDIEKEDNERDYIPQTDKGVNRSSKENIFGDSAEVIANHKQAFMELAYPLGNEHSDSKRQSRSAAIPTCRTKSELDDIAFVVRNWQVGVKVRDMEIGYEKANLIQFRRDHKKGNSQTDG